MHNKFPKQLRILKSKEYNYVFSNAYSLAKSCFLILARENKQNYPRLGLVISKKNVKLAVGRNRIKRIIRESFRHKQNFLNGVDVIVIARKCMASLNNKELREHLDKQWEKLQKHYNIS